MSRPLTHRERAVLDALLTPDFPGVEELREEARTAVVVSTCTCGCPSVDFYLQAGVGMTVLVNAQVAEGRDGLFLFTTGGRLGGIEWVGTSDEDPSELPDPTSLVISVAG